MSSSPYDQQMMQLALKEARKCTPRAGAFCVGCVIIAENDFQPDQPIVLAKSHSRELEGNTHAEANALEKIKAQDNKELREFLSRTSGGVVSSVEQMLRTATVYTTMEPCSVRTSGLAPCADALIAAQIKRCVIGVGEPDDFVNCEGAQKLNDAGVDVAWMKGMEDECLEVARRAQ